jgi:GMP synthase (glutamine-hydrolysing)
MNERIIILDFGSQYTQLIARKIRELNTYCEILPYSANIDYSDNLKGVILSGSPCSVNQEDPPIVNIEEINKHVPVLGICYGAQLSTKMLGGTVGKSITREYGRAQLTELDSDNALFQNITASTVWMSHADTIIELPSHAKVIARTESIPVAAFEVMQRPHPWFGLQFHPEVTHSEKGLAILKNFVVGICKCKQDWTPAAYVEESIASIKKQVGENKVIMALSGGVDSTVAATLVHRAIGNNLTCVFVDNGLLRKNEFTQVLKSYEVLGLNIIGIDASERFYTDLNGKSDPEEKRKIIGSLFIEIFQEEANKIKDAAFLGQGTIYPDVIESVSVNGPSVTIKSHHNVGGLPEKMNLKLVEPLRYLFKDEVRRIGNELGLDASFVQRHPFPGPGLGIRILGEMSIEKVKMLQEADDIFIQGLRDHNLYHEVWQAGAMLLPVQSVGVMGDERTYEYTLALRAVTSVDGMTADWAHLPHTFLAKISNDIINKVQGINRVVYDISSKPPATIEWE